VADSANQVIVAAEAYGSESEYFPQMLDSLNETMKGLSGEEEPLKEAIVTEDTGYFTGGLCMGGWGGIRWKTLNMTKRKTGTGVLGGRSLGTKGM
jgi:hypothetical protein